MPRRAVVCGPGLRLLLDRRHEPEPTPSPAATEEAFDPNAVAPLYGTLLDDKNRPLAGWTVGVAGVERRITTDLMGRYRLELPLGPYELVTKNPEGQVALMKSVRLVTAKGMELPLVVSLAVCAVVLALRFRHIPPLLAVALILMVGVALLSNVL